MTTEVMLSIIMTECQDIDETDLSERIKACMKRAYDHWMATDEEVQFKGALAGAMHLSNEDERQLIKDSLKPLKVLAAAASGVPVDWANFLDGADVEKLIPLRRLWDEVKTEQSSSFETEEG